MTQRQGFWPNATDTRRVSWPLSFERSRDRSAPKVNKDLAPWHRIVLTLLVLSLHSCPCHSASNSLTEGWWATHCGRTAVRTTSWPAVNALAAWSRRRWFDSDGFSRSARYARPVHLHVPFVHAVHPLLGSPIELLKLYRTVQK